MIAGASWAWWLGFHAVVVALLVAEGLFSRRRAGLRSSWIVPLALAAAAGLFAVWIAVSQGRNHALEFLTGYVVELSLSIDNLFVFLVLLKGFAISAERQQKALLWGVGGAMILRALFIAAGVTLLERFGWVSWLFGGFLLYAAWQLARGRSADAAIPAWVRNLQPAEGSLLPVILAVEFTDLLFATDSVPAVLSITHNPFLAYTSNIAAVLGLRSLYAVLAALLDRIRFLHVALALLLGFVALKMLASPWFEVPASVSLAVIGAILAACALANALLPTGRTGTRRSS